MVKNRGITPKTGLKNEKNEMNINDNQEDYIPSHNRMSRKEYMSSLKNNYIMNRLSNFQIGNLINDEGANTSLKNTMMTNQVVEGNEFSNQDGLNSNRSLAHATFDQRVVNFNTFDNRPKKKIKINTGLGLGNDSIIYTSNDWSMLLDTGRNLEDNTKFLPKTSEIIPKPLTTSNKTRKYGLLAFRLKNSSRKTERVIKYTKRAMSKEMNSNISQL